MRLLDLDPEWYADSPARRGQGLTFDCPHCPSTRFTILFSNCLDGSSVSKHAVVTYQRRGTTFDTLTITPQTIFLPGHARVEIQAGNITWAPSP